MDLESLNNKQLRHKCLEFGLPNVPVTDSNRKILIKRLHAAMTGTTSKKQSTSKTSTPTNRRKTVHATITTTVSSGDEDDFVINTKRTNNVQSTESRRRQTYAPAPASPPKPKPSAPKQINERVVPIGFESVANSTRINETNRAINSANDNRQRRSVSLTKTGVLTTSYNQETVPIRKSYEQDMEEDEYEPEDDLDDVEMESVARTETAKVYTHPVYSGYNQQTEFNPTTYTSSNFAIPPSQSQPTANKLYPDLNSAGIQNDFYSNFDGMRASHSSTARYSNLGFTRNEPTSYIPASPLLSTSDTISRKTFVSPSVLNSSPIYQTTSNTKRYTTSGITKRHTARAIDNDELAASSSDDQYEAPYLSKFSRNLDNLKPEPIYKRTSYSASYAPVVTKRRHGTYDDDNNLIQLWNTLDQKYHLKTAFTFILCFVIAVFVYVFFLQ